MQAWTLLAKNEADTTRLGTALADAFENLSHLKAADEQMRGAWVVALVGPLGAGKTRLVRAVAVGLGADPRAVSSPTFVLVQQYAGRLPVSHFDTYRLRDAGEFEELGVEEYFAADGICLVEWADRVVEVLPREHLRVEIEIKGAESRKFRLTAQGKAYETLIARVARQWETSEG